MLRIVFAVKDRAIDSFLPPVAYVAEGQATREFKDEIEREGSPMRAHPDDYDLYRIGTFDDQTGKYTNEPEQPKLVTRGKDNANAQK